MNDKEKLRFLRAMYNISMKQICQETGISYSNLSKYSNGEKKELKYTDQKLLEHYFSKFSFPEKTVL